MHQEINFKDEIEKASERIGDTIVRTPLEPSPSLGQTFGANVYLKWESEQVTGSFKFRGALNKLRCLSREEKEKGVISASTGNHGLGLAQAAKIESVELTLVLPKNAVPEKRERLREMGVRLVEHGENCGRAEIHARELARALGRIYISPYNDWEIIFGQGTCGQEISEDLPDLEDVLVPVGGGGLISGIAGYLKSVKKNVRIVGVGPVNSQYMAASIKAGEIVEVEEKETLADGVAGAIEPGSVTFPLCKEHVDEFLTVEESLIQNAMSLLFKIHKKEIEGAGALAVAGLMKKSKVFFERKVVLIVSGGNISPDHFRKVTQNPLF